MEWYWILGIVIVCIVALGLVLACVLLLRYYIPRLFKTIQFKKIFKTKPERDPDLLKYETKAVVVPELRLRALVLRDVYASETSLLNQMKTGSGDYNDTVARLIEVRKDIKYHEKRFYHAIDLANYFAFEVDQRYEDYIK